MKKLIILAMLFGLFTQFNPEINAATDPYTIYFPENLESPRYLYTDISIKIAEGYTLEDKNAIETIIKRFDHLANNFIGPRPTHQDPIYHQNNLVSINEKAGVEPVVVDELLFNMIKDALELSKATNGFFNPVLGGVIDTWKEVILSNEYVYSEIPESVFNETITKINTYKNHIDPNKVILNETLKSVYLEDSLMRLDLGAYAKGYAAKEIEAYIKSKGYKHYLINLGSSTLSVGTALTDKGKERAFEIGLVNPLEVFGKEAGLLTVKNTSISSSGNYLQYATYQGRKYHHIISPFDLVPMDYYNAITLVGDDAALLDGLSTALFNMPLEEAKALLDTYDYKAVFFLNDGSIVNHNLTKSEFRTVGTKGNVSTLYLILGGVIVVGGGVLVLLSVLDKKKGAKKGHEEEKE